MIAMVTRVGVPAVTESRSLRSGGNSVTIYQPGQTVTSEAFDTFFNKGAPDTTFVFNPGHGLDVINQFRVGGTDHDTLSFSGTDFNNSIANVLRHTHSAADGSAVIVDPTTHDTVKLSGVSVAQLQHNRADFKFHG